MDVFGIREKISNSAAEFAQDMFPREVQRKYKLTSTYTYM